MNFGSFDSPALAAFSLLPIVIFVIWIAVIPGLAIFSNVLVVRFVRAHERISKNLEALSSRQLNVSPRKNEL